MTAVLAHSHTDVLQPFFLEDGSARGRLVRMAGVVDTILSRHAYPDVVSRLLAELICVAAVLSSNLKDQGIITIQVRGNGLVPLIVVDAVQGGQVRGYAQLTEGSEEAINAKPAGCSPQELVGEDSYLAITYDAGVGLQRYQGVVAFEGASLTDALAAYFQHSQQLDVAFKLHVDKVPHAATRSGWVAGAMMLERLATEGGLAEVEHSERSQDAWCTALALFQTLRGSELCDPDLELSELLYRLFHEQGVRITDKQFVSVGCRCSRERVYQLLMSMSVEDRREMLVDGNASVTCQFCNQTEAFSALELMVDSN